MERTMSTFINLSNHTSSKWSEKQLNAAKKLGDIIDMQFPDIDPEAAMEEIAAQAADYYNKIHKFQDPIVMVQGEFTFTYALVSLLRKNGILTVSACTKRMTKEQQQPDGTVVKTSIFEFVQFRQYGECE